jgi:hypothetical protein
MEGCFFELQEIGPPARVNTKPEVNWRSMTLLPQSVSE